jgi:hypothetical protein
MGWGCKSILNSAWFFVPIGNERVWFGNVTKPRSVRRSPPPAPATQFNLWSLASRNRRVASYGWLLYVLICF